MTVATPSVLVMARSAEGATVVSSESVLLPGTGSGVPDVTEAVSVMMPSIVVVTTIVIVAVAPSASAAERTGDHARSLRARALARGR